MTELSTMIELTGAELDAVAAGALVTVGDVDIDVLNDSINKNNVGVGVAVAVLGAAGNLIGQRTGPNQV
jgi:hypothetical protein